MRFKGDKKARSEILAALSLFSHIGLTMAVCVGGSIWFGHWLDTKIGTSPLFLLIMIVVGSASAIYSMFTATARFYKNDKKK